jgi:hypothetical protein
MNLVILLHRLVPDILLGIGEFVREHVVDDDPWDRETMALVLSAASGRPLPSRVGSYVFLNAATAATALRTEASGRLA